MSDIFESIVENDTDKVKSIIRNGKDIFAQRDVHYNMTPLHYVAYYNRPILADVIIDCGGDINSIDMFGCTPLHWACRNGYIEVVTKLIQRGADVNCRQFNNEIGRTRTPLHWACLEGHVDIINVLIDHGADPYLLWECRGYKLKDFLEENPDYRWEKTAFDCCKTEECREALLKFTYMIKALSSNNSFPCG